MKRPTIRPFALLALAGIVCVVGACTEPTRAAAPPPSRVALRDAGDGTPLVSASASPAPKADTWDGALPSFVAWTDPAAVDALLRGAPLPTKDNDPRSCNFEMPSQSCVPGSAAVDWSCRSDCATSCTDCTSACVSTIAACRPKCAARDAACDHGCGEAGGACVQACLAARDRCASGECAKRVAEYLQEVRTNYGCKDKRPALEICQRAITCVTACDQSSKSDSAREACRAACKKTRAAGCNAAFLQNVDFGNCFPYESPI